MAMPLPKPVLATVPRAPLSPPVPFPYPGPPGSAGGPRRLTFVDLLGLPLPGSPLGSPKPPVCTLLSGRFTVAGAALPVLAARLLTFTSSLGRLGWFVGVSLACSKTGVVLISGALASSFFTFGRKTFCCTKMCGCLGLSLGCSTGTGFGSGILTLGTGGGGGGGATGTSVTGIIRGTT